MSEQIKINLPDGSIKELQKDSTAENLAGSISEGLKRNSIAAEVNGELKDLSVKLHNNDKVRILTSKDPESLNILRHSTAHVMAQATQRLFPGAKIAIGPTIESGFYYDFDIPDHSLSVEDLPKIEEEMEKIIQENQKFERQEVRNVQELLTDFREKGEIYKIELLMEYANQNPTLYVCKKDGKAVWNDFCRGPHLPDTKFIKAFKLLSVAGAYWRGDEKNKMLQRIYATAFWTKDDLKSYLNFLEEAEKRDHRKLSTQLELFSVKDEVGPGLILWHPNLAIIREEIENYWRSEHRKRGYVIVNTPHMAKKQLWDISGHTEFYNENMYYIDVEEEKDYVLKPMNCPFHMLIYKAKRHSYRNLPIRMAELGTVYRKERSGALHGMSRVRGFTQDDAHIFCTPDQFIDEIHRIIELVDDTLKLFDLSYEVELSTRPDEFVGELENWNKAEAGLKQALEEKNIKYEINAGDGAFYGPKIDFKLKDAIGRTWQGATIQLDFNLPTRFDLKYTDKDGSLQTPVMLHRVIFGSMERFAGALVEHYAGAFPVWLAPVQAVIIPISDKHLDYADSVYKKMKDAGIRVELDDRSESMNYKIREAQNKKIPYMLVIGDKEIEAGCIALRARGKGDTGMVNSEEFIKNIKIEIENKK
ncbi:MAG TPA: threonine--tRNA ligase [Candidatus Gastranaerophilales bacterium]|nr:threonine--tRNA ligase [Candidatus Gastranaerophilales bacterium]